MDRESLEPCQGDKQRPGTLLTPLDILDRLSHLCEDLAKTKGGVKDLQTPPVVCMLPTHTRPCYPHTLCSLGAAYRAFPAGLPVFWLE